MYNTSMYIIFNIRNFSGDPNDYNYRQIGQLTAQIDQMSMDYNLSNSTVSITTDNSIKVEFENPMDYTVWSLVWSKYADRIVYTPMGTLLDSDD
jgi:hypothetical protein